MKNGLGKLQFHFTVVAARECAQRERERNARFLPLFSRFLPLSGGRDFINYYEKQPVLVLNTLLLLSLVFSKGLKQGKTDMLDDCFILRLDNELLTILLCLCFFQFLYETCVKQQHSKHFASAFSCIFEGIV